MSMGSVNPTAYLMKFAAMRKPALLVRLLMAWPGSRPREKIASESSGDPVREWHAIRRGRDDLGRLPARFEDRGSHDRDRHEDIETPVPRFRIEQCPEG